MGPVECCAFDDNPDTTSQLGYIGSCPVADSLLFLHYVLGPLRRLKRYGFRGLAGILNPERIPLVIVPAGKVKR